MIRKSILTLLLPVSFAMLFSSCSRKIATQGGEAMVVENESNMCGNDESDVVKGWVRIKLVADTDGPLNVGEFPRGGFASGNENIDILAGRIGAVEIQLVFSEGGRFAGRRREYGMHLWYDIRFDEDIPVERVVEAFGKLPEIEHAQPIDKIRMSQ